eukprot:6691938-Pyramimonas_sp.AAC.1
MSSTWKGVERVSKECRNSVGRVSPRARHVKTLEFGGTFLVLEILSGDRIKAQVGWNIISPAERGWCN